MHTGLKHCSKNAFSPWNFDDVKPGIHRPLSGALSGALNTLFRQLVGTGMRFVEAGSYVVPSTHPPSARELPRIHGRFPSCVRELNTHHLRCANAQPGQSSPFFHRGSRPTYQHFRPTLRHWRAWDHGNRFFSLKDKGQDLESSTFRGRGGQDGQSLTFPFLAEYWQRHWQLAIMLGSNHNFTVTDRYLTVFRNSTLRIFRGWKSFGRGSPGRGGGPVGRCEVGHARSRVIRVGCDHALTSRWRLDPWSFSGHVRANSCSVPCDSLRRGVYNLIFGIIIFDSATGSLYNRSSQPPTH